MKYLFLSVVLLFCLNTTLLSSPNYAVSKGFMKNEGQIVDQNGNTNRAVLYLLQLGNTSVQLRQHGFSYEVKKDNQSHRVDIDLIGSNPDASVEPLSQQLGNFFYHNTSTSPQAIGVNHFGEVIYREVYPGIDIEFLTDASMGNGNQFKYNFIIHPGADINKIKLDVQGANAVYIDKEGSLHLVTKHGELIDKLPISYEADSKEMLLRKVKVGFTDLGKSIFGLKAESYNASKLLVVDPLLWGTYFGGPNNDDNLDVTTDVDSAIVVCGFTTSTSEIATTGAYQTTIGGSQDAYVARFSANGSLQWATYFGGSGAELFRAIDIGLNGEIFVVGNTVSDGIATAGAPQTLRAGSNDGIIVSFSKDGLLRWATYLGGTLVENLLGVHCNKVNGNLVVAGSSTSTTMFPQFANVHSDSIAGNMDVLIAKYTRMGALTWLSYYGGEQTELAEDLVTDDAENIYLGGNTSSSSGIATFDAFRTTKASGTSDALFSIFKPDGTLKYGTYYGGGNPDFFMDICLGKEGNVVLVGYTNSADSIATSGAFKTTLSGTLSDGFITNFDTSGVLKWASYYGGTSQDYFYGVTAGAKDKIYCGGLTFSDTAIATADAEVPAYRGGGDGMVTVFNSDGSLYYTSYFGGKNLDVIRNLTMDVNQNLLLVGNTVSDSFIATPGAYKTVKGSGNEAYIAKMRFGNTVTIPCDFVAGFTVNQLIQCERGNAFVFKDTTTAVGVNRVWDFGNGNTGLNQEERVSYVFGPQNYADVRLTLSAGTCESIATQRIYLIANPQAKSITGNDLVKRLELATYSVPFTNGSTYEWFYENGIGSSRSNTINIRWTSKGKTNLKVLETNSGSCLGDTIILPIIIAAATGEGEIEPTAISIYPNPVHNKLSLIGVQANDIKYTILNSVGSELIMDNYTLGVAIDTSTLPIGYYILVLKNNNGEKQVYQFIKANTY